MSINSSYMLTNVNTILQKAEIKYFDLFQLNKFSLKKALQNRGPQPDWRSNIVRELMDIRDGQLLSNLEKDESNSMLRHTQTHTDTHRHTQTHTDTHRHTQTHT